MSMKKNIFISCLLIFLLWRVSVASAATVNVVLVNDTFAIGDKFGIDIQVDSEGDSINAAQATVQFPKDILQAESVSKDSSVFPFWVQEPTIDKTNANVTFMGGSTSGFSGKSLQVVHINFVVIGAGIGDIVINDAAVTASDGLGTNVLKAVRGATINVPSKGAPPPGGTAVTSSVSQVIPPPVQIVRKAVASKVVPEGPAIEVPLYPDEKKWYNIYSNFLAKWKLPPDVSAVATALNKQPNFEPTKSEGLFDNKVFPAQNNGIWYLHVRFKNNQGWGPTRHYCIAIDTAPPTAFDISAKEGLPTDVPDPTISYLSSDQFSGIENYYIKVDNGEFISTAKTTYKLPLLSPGKHSVLVRVKDNAQNITESTLQLDILPIDPPIVTSINRDVFVNEGGLSITGIANVGYEVLVSVKSSTGEEVAKASAAVTPAGLWGSLIDKPLKKGDYSVDIFSKDSRGALSFPVKEQIRVRERPLLKLFGFEITQFMFFMGLIMIFVVAFIMGFFSNRLARRQRGNRVIIAERDVVAAFNTIKKDLELVLKNYINKQPTEQEVATAETVLKRATGNIEKMRKYIVENIKEIND